jgi:hypothetical protein
MSINTQHVKVIAERSKVTAKADAAFVSAVKDNFENAAVAQSGKKLNDLARATVKALKKDYPGVSFEAGELRDGTYQIGFSPEDAGDKTDWVVYTYRVVYELAKKKFSTEQTLF